MIKHFGYLTALGVAALLASASTAHAAAAAGCDTGKFLWQVDRLDTWKAIHDFYRGKPACPDKDTFSLAYSDVVVRMFAQKWQELPELQALMAADHGFGDFVLRHVDVQGDAAPLKKVVYNSAILCPAGAEALCRQITERAAAALKQKGKLEPLPGQTGAAPAAQ